MFYSLVGLVWSASTWRHGFDMGWLLVAFLVTRSGSARMEHGRLGARDYANLFWPAAPGFLLEGFSDLSLHGFRLYGGRQELVRFAVSSCLFLIFIAVAIAILRFGIGIKELSVKDEAMWRGVIWFGVLATAISVAFGTFIIFVTGTKESSVRLNMLQSWFYKTSLIVYFLLTMKIMFPWILRRLRAAFDQGDARF